MRTFETPKKMLAANQSVELTGCYIEAFGNLVQIRPARCRQVHLIVRHRRYRMDWEMITVFTIMSIVFGGLMGLMSKSLIQGLFFILLFMGLVLTAALILITGYDGIFMWIAGPLTTLVPFYIIIKFKYPDKLSELNKKLKPSKELHENSDGEFISGGTTMNGVNVPKSNAVSIAKKWATWPAGFGALVGISGVMKGSGTLIGKMLLSVIVAGTLALILGGITFVVVYGFLKLRGR